METNVNEVKTEAKIDKRVLARDTKPNNGMTPETIYFMATATDQYLKRYIPQGSEKERRTKHVHLPVSIDGKRFEKVQDLFDHLLATGAYRQVTKIGA